MARKFDRLLDSATDSTNLEPNWDGIIACFDSVRAGDVPAKAAIASIQKRIQHENPHVVHHALLVLDACVKNCGPKFHSEIATREFMEFFKNIPIENKYDKVKTKTLEMLQCWAMAFASKPEYKIVVDTHNLLKLAGFDFPSIKEADAMFLAQVAPDWADGPECFRCRAEFGLLTRKHHCRACGQIFCDRCSSHEMALPQFGIEKEVRVCEACFEKGVQRHNEKVAQCRQAVQEKKMMEILGDVVSPAEKEKLLKEKEEEDLAKALQLSKIEAEKKDKQEKNYHSLYNGDSSSFYPTEHGSASSHADVGYKGTASTIPESPSELSIAADDPLARYMNRDYWQQRKSQNKVEEWATNNNASAPAPSDVASVATLSIAAEEPNYASLVVDAASDSMPDMGAEVQAEETTKWCQQLKEQVGVMENRIRSNIARGRPVVNDTAIQGLFLRLTEYHAQVLERMHKLDEDRAYYEGLQDHLNHIVDARSAVTQLREDNERRKKEQLEAEQRMRQAQMKQTLDLMRMKKHAMLLEQRDTALQRFQQQEQEMQARRQQYPVYGNTNYMQSTAHPNVYGSHVPMYNMPYYQQQTQHAAQQYGQHPQMHSQYPQPALPAENSNPSSSLYSTQRSAPPVGQVNNAPTTQANMYRTPEYGNLQDQGNLSIHPMVRQHEQNGYNYQQYVPQQHPVQAVSQAPHPSNGYGYPAAQTIPPANVTVPAPEPSNETPLISFD